MLILNFVKNELPKVMGEEEYENKGKKLEKIMKLYPRS
jgi:hypothetical protein